MCQKQYFASYNRKPSFQENNRAVSLQNKRVHQILYARYRLHSLVLLIVFSALIGHQIQETRYHGPSRI